MPIQIICPNGHSLTIKGKYAGKEGLCPVCRAPIKVPLSDTAVLPAYSILAIQQMDESGVSIVMSGASRSAKSLGELLPVDGGAPVPLRKRVVLVGRTKDCGIVLQSSAISRHHAELRVIGDRWCVKDNNSRNGTLVNGHRVRNAWLNPGDVVAFAGHVYRVSYSRAALAASPPLSNTDRTFGELVPIGGGDPIPLPRRTLLVGRSESCDIVLPFSTISQQHAELRIVRNYWWVEDSNSTNGIEVNGAPIFIKRLNPGDRVAFAEREYKINYAPTALAALDPPWQMQSTPGPDGRLIIAASRWANLQE